MQTVAIRKQKRPVGSGSWSGFVVDEDRYGAWVFTPAHSMFVGYDGIRHTSCEVAQDSTGAGRDSLVLLPRDRWFVAHFVDGDDLLVHVDISTPPHRVGTTWIYDDLELDPFLTVSGEFGIEDEGEFEQSWYAGLISADEREFATLTAAWLAESIGHPDAPLVALGRSRLEKARTLGLRPLVE